MGFEMDNDWLKCPKCPLALKLNSNMYGMGSFYKLWLHAWVQKDR
jgi:hypothetical protein